MCERTMASLLASGHGRFFIVSHSGNDIFSSKAQPDIRTTGRQPARAEDIFVLGEDTVHLISNVECRHVMLVVIALLLLPGCAITAPSSGRSTIIAALSYELPLHADVKSVVDFLEEIGRAHV